MKPNETVLIPAGIGKPALRALAAAGIKALKMWRAQTKTISWRFMALGRGQSES
jgi:predicted Fe-Mo cluster-binding NifX family protein